MRKSSREKHQAIAQFVGLSLLAAVLAGVTAWDLRQPADATQLALPISIPSMSFLPTSLP